VAELANPPCCILFALGREARPFFRQYPIQKKLAASPVPAFVCEKAGRSVLVLETGVGRQRMEQALTWLLSQSSRPKLVISAGFSGALRAGLHIADIIVATEVIDEAGGLWKVPWPGEIAGHTFQRGKIVTVSGTVAETGEKLALGQKHDAIAVDMETAVVARMCADKGILFGCIRAISDDVRTPLSADVDYVIVNGRVSGRRLLWRLLCRPWFAAELWRLAKHTRLAADHLALALCQLFNVAADF
jgi:adenosylhomocysteine nucleosidase